MAGQERVPLIVAEPLAEALPNVRVPLQVNEPLAEGQPDVRAALAVSEPLTEGGAAVQLCLIVTEVLIDIPEEAPVATAVFPTLRGLTWDIKKNPEFSTAVRQATSGRETRLAYRADPIWHFELAYEWLPDYKSSVGLQETDYRVLQGFFLARGGKFQAWLFRDPDDYHVAGGRIATGDGVTLQWPFARQFSAEEPDCLEPVGQIDLSTLASFASTAVNTSTNAITVADHGLATGQGPLWVSNAGGALPTGLAAGTAYWAIKVDADHFKLAASKANALAGTPIALTAQGSGTDTLTKGVAVYDNGALVSPSAYDIVLPNQLVFATAPSAGHLIAADFDFWFVCRFEDDLTDLKQFAAKFWDLDKLTFQSVIS